MTDVIRIVQQFYIFNHEKYTKFYNGLLDLWKPPLTLINDGLKASLRKMLKHRRQNVATCLAKKRIAQMFYTFNMHNNFPFMLSSCLKSKCFYHLLENIVLLRTPLFQEASMSSGRRTTNSGMPPFYVSLGETSLSQSSAAKLCTVSRSNLSVPALVCALLKSKRQDVASLQQELGWLTLVLFWRGERVVHLMSSHIFVQNNTISYVAEALERTVGTLFSSPSDRMIHSHCRLLLLASACQFSFR